MLRRGREPRHVVEPDHGDDRASGRLVYEGFPGRQHSAQELAGLGGRQVATERWQAGADGAAFRGDLPLGT